MFKSIILAGVAALALPLSASAGTILPNLYASNYCEARDMGMTADDARTYAMRQAYISSGNPPYVTINGQRVQTDVVKAVRTAASRCPQYFR